MSPTDNPDKQKAPQDQTPPASNEATAPTESTPPVESAPPVAAAAPVETSGSQPVQSTTTEPRGSAFVGQSTSAQTPQPVQPVQPTEQVPYVQPAEQTQPAVQVSPVGQEPVAAKQTNPGLIILQWLTYAFWGWTVLALSALTASVVASFIDKADSANSFTAYGIAAVLVLLPISYICDRMYGKREPAAKEGAATWVMVIHAVIFALFGIGALITAVIALVTMLTSSSDTDGPTIVIISSLIIAGFYGLTFMRTLNPAMFRGLQRSYKYIMLGLVGIIALLGLLGPVASERATRNDRLIESELYSLTDAISDYTRENNKLPADLDTLDLRDDTQKLVDLDLVTYKPVGAENPVVNNLNSLQRVPRTTSITYRYQLCANYKQASKETNSYGSSLNKDADGYTSYVTTYNHPAGEVCYKLKTTDY